MSALGHQAVHRASGKIKRVIVHPAGNRFTGAPNHWPVDLVIIHLAKAVGPPKRGKPKDVALAALAKPGQMRMGRQASFAGWAASTQFGRFLRFRVATVPVNNVPQCHKAMRGDRIDPVDWFNPRLEWCTSAGDKTSFCAGDTGAGLYTVAKVKGVLTPIVHGIFSRRGPNPMCLYQASPCACGTSVPDLFTKVDPQLWWIRPKILN